MSEMTIVQALQVTGVCMGVVFTALIVIMFLIEMFKYVFPDKGEDTPLANLPAAANRTIASLDLEEDLIVAMTAAVNLSNDQGHTRMRIVSFREVG